MMRWDQRTWPQPRWGCGFLAERTQGSSFLATLGFVPESRLDALFSWTLEDACKVQRGLSQSKTLTRSAGGRGFPFDQGLGFAQEGLVEHP